MRITSAFVVATLALQGVPAAGKSSSSKHVAKSTSIPAATPKSTLNAAASSRSAGNPVASATTEKAHSVDQAITFATNTEEDTSLVTDEVALTYTDTDADPNESTDENSATSTTEQEAETTATSQGVEATQNSGTSYEMPALEPFTDSSCSQELPNYSYTSSFSESKKKADKPGVTSNQPIQFARGGHSPALTTISKFQGNTKESIYWKINNVETTNANCRAVLMKKYPKGKAGKLPGQIFLTSASSEECMFAGPMPAEVVIAHCCGNSCNDFNMGTTLVNEQNTYEQNRDYAIAHHNLGIPRSVRTRDVVDSDTFSGGSLAARAAAHAQRDNDPCTDPTGKACLDSIWGSCTYEKTGEQFQVMGDQKTISDWVDCSAGCEISAGHSVTFGSEVSTSSTNTDTHGSSSSDTSSSSSSNKFTTQTKTGTSVTVEAGIHWGPISAGTSVTHDDEKQDTKENESSQSQSQTNMQSMSNALSTESGQKFTNGTTTTVNKTLKVESGLAALSYTAYNNCQNYKVKCAEPFTDDEGNDVDFTPMMCNPAVRAGTTEPDGQLNIVYTSGTTSS